MAERKYFLKFLNGKLAVINGTGRYNKLVRVSDGKEISIFLNPAIYGGVSTEVVPVWNGTTLSFIPTTASELDDRYTVGKQRRLVFGGTNAYPVDLSVDLSQYETVTVPETAYIAPLLLFRVQDYRLATYDTFALAFPEFFKLLQDDLASSTPVYDVNDYLLLFNAPKQFFLKFSNALFGTCTKFTVDDTTELTILIDEKMLQHDGTELAPEHLFGMSNTLSRGSFYYSVLNSVFCGRSVIPYTDTLEKPLNGALTIFARPEKLISFNEMVANAVDTVANTISDATVKASFKDLANKILREGLKDWFKPSSYRVLVGYNGTTPVYQNVNVFLTFQGSYYRDGLVMIDSGGVLIGVPVTFGDTFDYTVGEAQKAYPGSKSYVTGPYGAIPIYDSNGNIIDWYSDAYSK